MGPPAGRVRLHNNDTAPLVTGRDTLVVVTPPQCTTLSWRCETHSTNSCRLQLRLGKATWARGARDNTLTTAPGAVRGFRVQCKGRGTVTFTCGTETVQLQVRLVTAATAARMLAHAAAAMAPQQQVRKEKKYRAPRVSYGPLRAAEYQRVLTEAMRAMDGRVFPTMRDAVNEVTDRHMHNISAFVQANTHADHVIGLANAAQHRSVTYRCLRHRSERCEFSMRLQQEANGAVTAHVTEPEHTCIESVLLKHMSTFGVDALYMSDSQHYQFEAQMAAREAREARAAQAARAARAAARQPTGASAT